MSKPEEYGIAVRLVRDDGEEMYEARVAELPDVTVYENSFGDAYAGALEVIKATKAVFEEKGKAFPEPQLAEDEFSGRVTLRMSKSIHRAVHAKVQTEGVSLNQWIVEAISCRLGGVSNSANSVIVCTPLWHNSAAPQMTIRTEEAILWNSFQGTSIYLANPANVAWNNLLSSPVAALQVGKE